VDHVLHCTRRGGALVAGLLAIAVLTTTAGAVLHATGVFPPAGEPMADRLWTLAVAYRFVFGVVGGHLTATLAPDRPLAHAVVLGAIGFLFSIGGAAVAWDRGPGFGPAWYSLAVIAVALPGAWLGGRLACGDIDGLGPGTCRNEAERGGHWR
jgi:hypothetical protein